MRRVALSRLVFFLPLAAAPLRAAFEEKPASPRTAALGGSGAGDPGAPDAWLLNPAALRFLDRRWMSTAYTRVLGEEALSLGSLAAALPTEGRGSFGLSFLQFGGPLYMEREASLVYAALPAPSMAAGLSLSGHSLDMARYGRSTGWSLGAGVLGRPHPRVSLGLSIRRVAGSNPAAGRGPAPLTRAGVSLSVLRSTWLTADLAKSRDEPFSVRAGLETFLTPGLCLRAGGQSRPSRYALGLGVLSAAGRLDYAFLTHPFLGDQHLASFSFPWGRPRRGS